MKLTKTIIIVAVLLSSIGLSAQNEKDIQQIRKWYYAAKKQIENSKKTKKGSYSCIVLEYNAYKNEGSFYSKQEFWQNIKPECSENHESAECLEMFIMNSKAYYAEYFYHKGDLVFVFVRDNLDEFRFYFKNDKLLKEVKGNKVQEGMNSPSSDDIRRSAAIYMNQYLSGFCVPND